MGQSLDNVYEETLVNIYYGEPQQDPALRRPFSAYSSYPVVAPFAAYTYTNSIAGYVGYNDTLNSQLSVVSEHIRSEMGTSFNGTWMLVAEWNRVPSGSEDLIEDEVSMLVRYTVSIIHS